MGTHLRPEDLIDIAEGARAESAEPHLAECDRCQAQLAELRATMASLTTDAVPEPSPFFWDQLQARVSETVAAEGRPSRLAAWSWLFAPRVVVAAAAVAAVVLAVVLGFGSRLVMPPVPNGPDRVATKAPDGSELPGASRVELLNDSVVDEDPSLQLVAGLTASMDANAAGEAGLSPHGSAEHAVTHLSAGELAELRRILTEELAKSGA